MKYSAVKELVDAAQSIIVLQADNPDGDSLGSALALESILSEMGKQVHLVCAVDIPSYLRYLPGWDRVTAEVPSQFNLTIIVDNSSESLFEVADSFSFSWVKSKPVLVVDHHVTSSGISFADVSIVEEAVATSELIYAIATDLDWPLPLDACEMMATSIMSDSLGLTTDAVTAQTFGVMAGLAEHGVNMAKLDAARRDSMKKDPVLIPYKGELLKRVTFDLEGQLAHVSVTWPEIEKYSPLYNPTMLVIEDMRMTVGVRIAIGYKIYNTGRITAKIRCNFDTPIAAKLAEEFGGGGHPYAAGFKVTNGTSFEALKKRVHDTCQRLLLEQAQ